MGSGDRQDHSLEASDAGARGGGGAPIHGWRVGATLVLGVVLAGGLIVRFPNLRENAGYLALVVLTPLLAAAVVAIARPVLGRAVPGTLTVALRSAFALCLVLDLSFFVVVGFIRTEVHDSAPVFITATTTSVEQGTASPSASATATIAAPPELHGNFDGRAGIDTASGQAILGTTAGGVYVLRLQDFAASHGPDLYVYLSRVAAPTTPSDVMSGLEVSALKATSGDQNYSLPDGFDAGTYKSVVIYCKSFSTIFGYATLA